MVADVNHEMQNDAAYHAKANCGSLQIHTGKKRQKNRDPWEHETGRNDHLLQASGGIAVRARQLGDFLPFRLTLASHEESLMHPLTKILFHILASKKIGLLLFCQGLGVFVIQLQLCSSIG